MPPSRLLLALLSLSAARAGPSKYSSKLLLPVGADDLPAVTGCMRRYQYPVAGVGVLTFDQIAKGAHP